MPRKSASVTEWINRYLKEEEPKSKSLIVSVFGDSIAPRARGIWLGDLIGLLRPFGVSERLVRTSAFRLIEEDWLAARRDGRRSYYSLTPAGVRRLELACERVYTPLQEDWDGAWTMVMIPRAGDSASDRTGLRRELEWEGFASPTPGLMVHPSANHEALQQVLVNLGMTDRVAVLRAHAADNFSTAPINLLISQCWDLGDISDRYEKFVERFKPLRDGPELPGITPQQAFMIQTLLIHSFRRATLHDPRLPTSILAPEWPGMHAYALCRQIYQLTYRKADVHLQSACETEAPPESANRPSMQIQQRFGGLQ